MGHAIAEQFHDTPDRTFFYCCGNRERRNGISFQFIIRYNKTLERYASNFNESIIIQQLITEAPTLQVQGIDTISIEKLIVDCLAEKELLFAHQEELDNIFSSIAERFNVSIKSARRYASRRGQSAELDKVLHTYFKVSALNEKSAKS
jgi:hypothetical protein